MAEITEKQGINVNMSILSGFESLVFMHFTGTVAYAHSEIAYPATAAFRYLVVYVEVVQITEKQTIYINLSILVGF